MEKLKKEVKSIKPWFILVTYFVGLIFLLMYFNRISEVIGKYMKLLNPFFMAIAIAFVLNIPMKSIENFIKKNFGTNNLINKFSRSISIILTLIFTLIFLFFMGHIIVPQLITTIVNLVNNLTNIVNGIVNNTDQILEFFKLDGIQTEINTDTINNFFTQFGLDWNNIIKNVTNMVSNTGVSVFSYVSNFTLAAANWFLALMLSLYLLGGKEKFIRQIKKVVAAVFDNKTRNVILKYSRSSLDIFNSFISGQLLEAIIIGVLIYIALLLFKMPYSLLVASITSIMALVPILGATLACVIGFFLILSIDPIQALWFVVLYQVVQQLENNFIYPKIVGESVGLPGIWTLLSIVVFGGMYGVLGMLLAVPITAILYTSGSELINKRLNEKNLIVTTEEIKEKGLDDL